MKKYLIPIIVVLVLINAVLFVYATKDAKLSPKQTHKKAEVKEEKVVSNDLDKYKGLLFEPFYEKALKTVQNMSLEEKVGQVFLVRYNLENVANEANYYPGGYILFAKDFENHTKDSLKAEIANDQKLSKYPLIIAVDEEGGTVTRVSRFKAFRNEKFPSPQTIFAQGGYPLLEQIEKEKADLLLSLGINTNLAPVADVSTDSNDFIYDRSFGKNATETAEYVKNMVNYSKTNKINACLKHFPGYGNNVDTHTGIAVDDRSYANFTENDFLPFKAGIDAGVPSILVSHNVINSIDSTHPASLSEKVIGELRNTLQFSGVVITDDLAMDAVKSYVENGEAATLALQAGDDMIITSDFINMYNEVLNSVKNGTIKEEVLDEAVIRNTAWKYASNLY